jgi:hypothetical protein
MGLERLPVKTRGRLALRVLRVLEPGRRVETVQMILEI